MHDFMNKFIEAALLDADIVLLMTETGTQFQEDVILEKLNVSGIPVLVLINKIDLSNQEDVVKEISSWNKKLPKAEVIPISALEAFNVSKVFDLILEKLPESPAYYDKEEFTTRSMRFFMAEIIREKILLNYKKEIPYSVEVAVESYKEEKNLIRIAATIFVSRESQKAIILGHQGRSIKKTASQARIEMEEFIGSKVFLEVTVKVKKDWRDNETMLRQFGYDQ
jgi:GTP-binding protein Era